MKYMEKTQVKRERLLTRSWRTCLVSSFAGTKGGLGLDLLLMVVVFGSIEDYE